MLFGPVLISREAYILMTLFYAAGVIWESSVREIGQL